MFDRLLFGIFTTLLFCYFCEWTCVNASCSQAKLCCGKQNNTCYTTGYRMEPRSNTTARCFCDENCLTMKDCCADYQIACSAVDCEVSGWSPWGKCRNQCGIGSQEREREIEVFPQNGGRACPVSRQKRVCVGYEDCLQQSVEYQGAELRETGKILPAKFGIWRTAQEYDPKQGINWNLFAQYHSNEILRRPAYCSEYEIITSHKRCETSVAPWAGVLKEGGRMCVECQPTAMHKKLGMRCKGHGVFREETTWTAVDVPGCHGSWVMKKRHEDCTCNVHGDFDFILI